MRWLHISDLHLPAPWKVLRGRALLAPKRLLGLANHRLRRRRHFIDAATVLERLVDWAHESLKPDGVIFSGDAASLGSHGELMYVRRVMDPLVSLAPVFACVPGNHDLYTHRAPFAQTFGDLCPGLQTPEGGWPRRLLMGGETELILLNSARPRWLPVSGGRLGAGQLLGLQSVLDETEDRPLFRLVVLHHAPRRADGRPDTILHGLAGRAAFEKVLAGRKRLALLHGHLHRTYTLRLPGLPPAYCAGSTTIAGHAGCWVFDLRAGELWARRGRFRNGAWALDPADPVPGTNLMERSDIMRPG